VKKKATPRAVVPSCVSLVSIDDKIDALSVDIGIVRHNVLGIYDMLSTLFEYDNNGDEEGDDEDNDEDDDEDDEEDDDEDDEEDDE